LKYNIFFLDKCCAWGLSITAPSVLGTTVPSKSEACVSKADRWSRGTKSRGPTGRALEHNDLQCSQREKSLTAL